uniref:Uncharacterized protein n=1 Tax=Anguilla anguilla TaxID=7936 RepID=A0A0E9PYD6_ANGAN
MLPDNMVTHQSICCSVCSDPGALCHMSTAQLPSDMAVR